MFKVTFMQPGSTSGVNVTVESLTEDILAVIEYLTKHNCSCWIRHEAPRPTDKEADEIIKSIEN